MKVSLVVATVGRTHQLARLLESLARQTWQDFECIIIDQNPPGTLDALLEAYGCTPEAPDMFPVPDMALVTDTPLASDTTLGTPAALAPCAPDASGVAGGPGMVGTTPPPANQPPASGDRPTISGDQPPSPALARPAGTSHAEGAQHAPGAARPAYRLRHLRYLPARHGGVTGVSAARNAGLDCITGDIVGFPDDDCHYADDTLANVVAAFRDTPGLSGIVGRCVTPQATPQATPGDGPGDGPCIMSATGPGVMSTDGPGAKPRVTPDAVPGVLPGVTPQVASGDVPRGMPTGGHPSVSHDALNRFSAFRGSETYLLFFRRAVVDEVGGFDPTLGPGTGLPFGCGEDTDYLLRAIACGFRVARAAGVHVHHPAVDIASPDVAAKAYAYGVGRARLLRKHRLPAWFIACNVAYPLARLPLEGPKAFAYRWNMFRGRLAGLAIPFAPSPPSGHVSPCGPVASCDHARPRAPAPPHGPT